MTTAAQPERLANGSPRLSLTPSTTLPPTWGPPKAPLPPHRLAKLANALGVSTPMPAVHLAAPFMSRSRSQSPGPSDTYPRSPTPSTSATNFTSYSPIVSKYLLHVIPPLHLPHETDQDSDLTPPPATASGYHTQFRRGTLVPLHSNFQSQLGAIAKEYALPSTTGLILYLVSSARNNKHGSPASNTGLDDSDEPGPRLSEDIWRHIWTRVMKFEQRDDNLLPRSPTPNMNMYSPTLGAPPTPLPPHDPNGQALRPFISTVDTNQPRPITPIPPSPSTPSSISNPKSAPPSSSSVSQSDGETADTSSASHSFFIEPETRANSLDLHGLDSSSVIPILAKVEFDIDRHRAPWYDPWIRSRKMNQAKRADSRGGRKASVNESGEPSDDAQEKHKHIGFLTGRAQTTSPVSLVLSPAEKESTPDQPTETPSELPPFETPELEPEHEIAGYEQLTESQDEDEFSESDSDSDEEFTDEITARVVSAGGKDPLADVFGTDADTWTDIQGSPKRDSKRQTNPNIVEFALSDADMTALPSPTQSEFEYLSREVDEVQAILDRMSLSISATPFSPPNNRSSSPTGSKRHIPSPLILVPGPSTSRDLAVPAEPSPIPNSAGTAVLEYLNDEDDRVSPEGQQVAHPPDEEVYDEDFTRTRTPAELEKREGAVYDDLDLGLDPSEDVSSQIDFKLLISQLSLVRRKRST